MIRTVYSTMSTVELLDFAQTRPSRTEMESELAERLEIALLMQAECDNDVGDVPDLHEGILDRDLQMLIGHG